MYDGRSASLWTTSYRAKTSSSSQRVSSFAQRCSASSDVSAEMLLERESASACSCRCQPAYERRTS